MLQAAVMLLILLALESTADQYASSVCCLESMQIPAGKDYWVLFLAKKKTSVSSKLLASIRIAASEVIVAV